LADYRALARQPGGTAAYLARHVFAAEAAQ
jgi:hypothetical protein